MRRSTTTSISTKPSITKKLYGDYQAKECPVFNMNELLQIVEKLNNNNKELTYKIINLMATCGFMRCGEVYLLRWPDVEVIDEQNFGNNTKIKISSQNLSGKSMKP